MSAKVDDGDERGLEPVHVTFATLARARPSAIAAISGTVSLTYAELDQRSDHLARSLVARGVSLGRSVAVCLPPSCELLVAILATFKAGGVYVPIDASQPPAMNARILAAAAPCVQIGDDVLAPSPAPSHAIAPSLDRAATLFFTSGTTGAPKGVVGTHANLAHHLDVARRVYRFDATDVFCSLARPTFSISVFELLSPLTCGGAVRLFARSEVLDLDRLAGHLDEVTVVHAGPSLLGALHRHLEDGRAITRIFPKIRHASTGGDVVPPTIVDAMVRLFPNAEPFVIYGCTEVSCMATTHRVVRGAPLAGNVVGVPFPNVEVRLLDRDARDVAPGESGEIHVAGPGVVRGYLELADLPACTSERFVDVDGRRAYATGDRGRFDGEGRLEFLGRDDFQVQVRGVRVELLGVENTIRALGLARACAVVANRSGGEVSLVAFVVGAPDPTLAALRRALAVELPEAMLPQRLVVVDALPLTGNGKIDRRQLEAWASRPAAEPLSSSAPLIAIELEIAGVFARLLRVATVGVDDDFFDLGGDSLLAIVAARDVARILGAPLAPEAIFASATARSLAERGAARRDTTPRPIPLNRASADAPLFALSGAHAYRHLARHLDGRCALFGVISRHDLDTPTDAPTIESLARAHVEIIRREQPRGPYRLLGNSFAGIVAYEVAQQLRARGEAIELLALVDPQLPEWSLGWRARVGQLRRLAHVPPRALVEHAFEALTSARADPRDARAPAISRLADTRAAINARAATEYAARMRPFAGDVLLFTSLARIRSNPANTIDSGWRAHVAALEIETIDAGHHELLEREPHVGRIAEVLMARLSSGR